MRRNREHHRQRDAAPALDIRMGRISERSNVADNGEITVIASSDAAVDMGGVREVLSHEDGAIHMESARTVLFNHDRDQPIGQILSLDLRGSELHARLRIREDARAANGVSLRGAVRDGDIEGISIGYTWRDDDAEFDRKEQTITVHRWMLREISITPTQADIAAKVTGRARSLADRSTQTGKNPKEERTMGFDAWLKARGFDPDEITDEQRAALQKDYDAELKREADEAKKREMIAQSAGTITLREGGDEAARANEIAEARQRAEAAERTLTLTRAAQGFGINCDGEDLGRFESVEAGLQWLTERKAKQEAEGNPDLGGIQARSRIDYDQVDKAREAVDIAIAQRVGLLTNEERSSIGQNPLVGRSYLDMASRWLGMLGVRNAHDWDRRDLAMVALGQTRNISTMARRDAANVLSGDYASFVTLDAITKIVARGYEMGAGSVNYQVWSERNIVPDFKAVKVGSLGTGNLQETAEGIAFPELEKSEGVYSEEAKMWGGTLFLTLQALVNDDTGEFDRSLRQAGAIAQKTIDKRVYQKLLRGTTQTSDTSTWTSNTTTGDIQYTTADTAYAARVALDAVIAAMMNKIGQDGNPLGNTPRYLLCAPGIAGQARSITGGVAPGQVNTHTPVAGDIQVVPSVWLNTNSGLTGADSAHYYLVADPMQVTGMLVNFIRGMEGVQVMEFDSGPQAARGWKIFQAFEASLVSQANSAGTTIIAAAQQGVD